LIRFAVPHQIFHIFNRFRDRLQPNLLGGNITHQRKPIIRLASRLKAVFYLKLYVRKETACFVSDSWAPCR